MNDLPTAHDDPELTEWLKWQLQHGTIFRQNLAELAFNTDAMQYFILRPALLTFATLNALNEESGDAEKPYEVFAGALRSDSGLVHCSRMSQAKGFSCSTTVVKVIDSHALGDSMKVERIDTDEIVGLTCPKTGNRILWADDDIEDALRGSIVLGIVTSLYPEECGFNWMPLAAAWKAHYAVADTRKMSLDEVVEAFPAPGKALKVLSSGIACGPVYHVTYFIVPEDLPDGCFIRADSNGDADTQAEE